MYTLLKNIAFLYTKKNFIYTSGEFLFIRREKMTVNAAGQITYNEFVQELQQNGYRTTSLGANETNFEQYGNALSGNLKKQLMDSFDCEQDYQLQSQIASLYNSNKSVINSGDFINSLKNMGLNVNVSYQETSYISDYKAGNTSGAAGNGAIAIYTIADSKGGEIKIADANGNGALEVEEIFMNQILGDITHEITSAPAANNAQASNSASNAVSNSVSETEYTNNMESEKEEEIKNQVSQDKFNKEVEKNLKAGASIFTATTIAELDLDVSDMTYTGTYLEEIEEQKKKEEEKQQKAA